MQARSTGQVRVLVFRQHIACFLLKNAILLGIGARGLEMAFAYNDPAYLLIPAVCVVLALLAARNYDLHALLITPCTIIVRDGWLIAQEQYLPRNQIQIRIKRGLFGWLFGYGHVELSLGQQRVKFRYIAPIGRFRDVVGDFSIVHRE